MKIFVLLNPASGGGRARGQKLILKKVFYQKGHDVVLMELTNFEKDLPRLIAEYKQGGHDVLAVAGGDGTVRAVINEVIGQDINILVLPLGTANVFSQEMGLGNNFKKAAELLETGVVKKFDIGKVKNLREKSDEEKAMEQMKKDKGENFLLMAGIGFDAEVIKNTIEEWKPKLKEWTYILAGFLTAVRYKYPEFDLEIEDQNGTVINESSFFTVISNSSYYGGPYKLAFDANMTDGLLDVVVFKEKGFVNIIKAFWSLKKNKFEDYPGVRFFKAKRIKVKPKDIGIVNVQLDGDVWENIPSEFWVEEKAVGIYIPKSKADEYDNKSQSNESEINNEDENTEENKVEE